MKIKFQLSYKGPKSIRIPLQSEWIDEEYAKALLDDFRKSGRIHDVIIMDEMGREWNQKEFEKLQIKMEDEPKNPIVYFDGGFDINSRKAGVGIVIYYKKGNHHYRYRTNSVLEALDSNNEAEYAALYNALLYLEEIGFHNLPVTFNGDSQGLIKQLEGEWPCYENSLNLWLDKIEEKIKYLGIKAIFNIISRKDNKEADQLATQALHQNMVQSHVKLD